MDKYPETSFYPDALYGKAMANYRMFHFNAALKSLNKIITDFPDSSFAEQAYFQRGICLYWLGQDDKAVQICNDFLKKYPDSAYVPDVLFWLGKYYYNHGDFEEAGKRMSLFAEKYKDLPLADEALYRAALSAFKRKEYMAAIDLVNRLVKDYPKSRQLANARFLQAEALSFIDKPSAAILVFDEIIKEYPDSDLVAAAWGRKGDCQFILGSDNPKRYKESIESYKIAANTSGADLALIMQAEYKIGRSLEKLGRIDDAYEQYYTKVIIRYINDRNKGVEQNEACRMWFVRAALDAADILEEKKDWRQAVKVLGRIVDAGVDTENIARSRIKKIKTEQWWQFY